MTTTRPYSNRSDGDLSRPSDDVAPGVECHDMEANRCEPSLILYDEATEINQAAWDAISRDIEQRRERIARKLEI